MNTSTHVDNDTLKYVLLEKTLRQLKENFICINCNEVKPTCFFHDDFCSSICYHQWRDYPLFLKL
jgi:hypothetical protein